MNQSKRWVTAGLCECERGTRQILEVPMIHAESSLTLDRMIKVHDETGQLARTDFVGRFVAVDGYVYAEAWGLVSPEVPILGPSLTAVDRPAFRSKLTIQNRRVHRRIPK